MVVWGERLVAHGGEVRVKSEFGDGGCGGGGAGGALIFDGAADDSPGDGVDACDGDSRHVAAEDEAAES